MFFPLSFSQRERAVRDMLTLHCPLQETNESVRREHFLTERLLIPEQWIHEAKAIRARRNADKHLEALHLYRAGYWNQCHRLLIQHLASGHKTSFSHLLDLTFLHDVSHVFNFICPPQQTVSSTTTMTTCWTSWRGWQFLKIVPPSKTGILQGGCTWTTSES